MCGAEINGEFFNGYGTKLSLLEQEILLNIKLGVICTDKTWLIFADLVRYVYSLRSNEFSIASALSQA